MNFFSKLCNFAPLLIMAIVLGACAGPAEKSSPWEVEDYRRPAEGAPNQLARSSLSNPDLFYANRNYSVQRMEDRPQAQKPSDPDRSNIPYQRFKQTLQDFSREQQQDGQKALEDEKKRQSFMGAKLPQDPGTTPGLQSSNQQKEFENQTQSDRDRRAKQPMISAALLIPLSGEHRHIGSAMLKASETALFNLGTRNFEILPRDTKGTPSGARQAMRSAIRSGADVVIGPLFAHSTAAIADLAERNNLKVFSFTTDWKVAGDNIFAMGFLPFSQVNKIVEHAALTDLKKIGVFAPDTDYGQTVIKAYRARADELGLETVDIVRYPVNSSNISPVIREFTRYDERVEKLNQLIRPLQEELEKSPDNEELEARIAELQSQDTAGEPPYDAVLLPVGGEQAKAIANLLSFYDLDPDDVVRLGTGLWDDPALATEPNMEGGMFAASSPSTRISFENQYSRLYGENPPRLATLAYDATALAIVLGRNRIARGDRDTDLYRLRDITNPNGFAGIDGIFRFRPNGLIERGLAILGFQDREIVLVNPAPNTFQEMRRF